MKIPKDLKINRITLHPLNTNDNSMGWEAYTFLKNQTGMPVGGGYSTEKEIAKLISVSETIERYHVRKINKSNNEEIYNKWGMSHDSSSSGFAFGDNEKFSLTGAICEAYERYVRYYGIYCGFRMSVLEVKKNTNIQFFLKSFFDKTIFYTKSDNFIINNIKIRIISLISLGFKNKGVFIGASSQIESLDMQIENLITHSLIEMYRNYRIFNNHLLGNENKFNYDHVELRTLKAGKDSAQILSVLNSSSQIWRTPEIKLLNQEYFKNSEGYLSRCLIRGVPSWENLLTEKLI